MAKTITQLAKELNVSRQAIHQAIDKILDKEKLQKKGNAFILKPAQETKVKQYFDKSTSSKPSINTSNNTNQLTESLQDQISFLRQELEMKNTQIERMQILLANEQEKQKLLPAETEKPQNWWRRFKKQQD